MLLPAASLAVTEAMMLLAFAPTNTLALTVVLKPKTPLPKSTTVAVAMVLPSKVKVTVSPTLTSPPTVPLRVTLPLLSAWLMTLSPPTSIGLRSMVALIWVSTP